MKSEESIAELCRQLKKLVADLSLRNQVLTKASPAWGWYYLLTVLDDYSRYIVSWKLFTGMSSGDATEVLDEAIAATGVEKIEIRHRRRLLSDNGPCFISQELGDYLAE